MAWLLAPWVKYAALGAAVLTLVAGGIAYHRHIQNEARQDGRNEVVNEVQGKTIETLDAARSAKEHADEETRRTPYPDRVDRLR